MLSNALKSTFSEGQRTVLAESSKVLMVYLKGIALRAGAVTLLSAMAAPICLKIVAAVFDAQRDFLIQKASELPSQDSDGSPESNDPRTTANNFLERFRICILSEKENTKTFGRNVLQGAMGLRIDNAILLGATLGGAVALSYAKKLVLRELVMFLASHSIDFFAPKVAASFLMMRQQSGVEPGEVVLRLREACTLTSFLLLQNSSNDSSFISHVMTATRTTIPSLFSLMTWHDHAVMLYWTWFIPTWMRRPFTPGLDYFGGCDTSRWLDFRPCIASTGLAIQTAKTAAELGYWQFAVCLNELIRPRDAKKSWRLVRFVLLCGLTTVPVCYHVGKYISATRDSADAAAAAGGLPLLYKPFAGLERVLRIFGDALAAVFRRKTQTDEPTVVSPYWLSVASCFVVEWALRKVG